MANLLQLIKTYDDFRQEAKESKPGVKTSTTETETRPPRAAFPSPAGHVQAVKPPAQPTAPPSQPPPPQPAATQPPPPPPAAPPPATAPAAVAPATAVPVTTQPLRSETESPARAAEAEGLYDRALVAVSRLFEAAVMESLTPGRLRSTVTEFEQIAPAILQSVAGGRGLLRKAMGTYAEGEGFVLPHSVNVAILAVELGGELGLGEQSLLDSCLAGFVHDLGSVRLPQGLLTKSESLTPSEWDEMRARPTYTYETMRSLGDQYERVAEISYQVYERLDGSGYPRGLQGDEILPEARILGTVDFFESFAHPRPYKTTLSGTVNHGIQMLMQMADKFGAPTLKALVGSIGLFPIGSYVRLSSGEIGRVVDVKKENPMRPVVEVLLNNERRTPVTPRTLDLLTIPQIYVSRALTASDLRELGLLPPPSRIFLPAKPENSLE